LRTFKVAFMAGAVERMEDRLRMQRYAEMMQVVASRSLMLATEVENDNYIARRFYFVRTEPERARSVERSATSRGGQPEQSGCVTGGAPAEWMTLLKRVNLKAIRCAGEPHPRRWHSCQPRPFSVVPR